MTISKNIVTDFGAVGDGVTENSSQFQAFNNWALINQGTDNIELTIPAGTYKFYSSSGANPAWVTGINDLTVLGTGATLSSSTGNFHLSTGGGQVQDASHSARVQSQSAGANTVTVLNTSNTALFTVGEHALITGFDLQGQIAAGGYPSNAAFFEYVQVTSISTATGVITFTPALTNSYLSTWPVYSTGTALEVDQGGPATLYALPNNWGGIANFQGLTIDVTMGGPNTFTVCNGRNLSFTNCAWTDGIGPIPSQNETITFTGCDLSPCTIENDKLVVSSVFSNCTINRLDYQSASITNVAVSNCTVGSITGTPRNITVTDSSITTLFRPGATGYGATAQITCNNVSIPSIVIAGAEDKGGAGDPGVNVSYSMSGGVISIPSSHGAMAWATPGAFCFWWGNTQTETGFSITSVTQDSSFTRVRTNATGGFPGVPLTGGKLYIRTHPGPRCTFTNCTGSVDAIDLSGAPANTPLYAYSRRTYTKADTAAPVARFPVWGDFTSVKLNVTSPYTGGGALTFNALSQFNNFPELKSDLSQTTYGPVVDIKTAGLRTITPSGVTNGQPGDSGLTFPSTYNWACEQPGGGATFSADVSGGANDFSVTVEINTNQGIPSTAATAPVIIWVDNTVHGHGHGKHR